MAALTRRQGALVALGTLYAAAVIPIGVHNGADLANHLPLVERLLTRQPPYAQPAGVGLWWPPFALLTLTPFALLARFSAPFAKGAFALLGVVFLIWTVARFDQVRLTHLVLAIAAVAVPLETNFEWLNWNTVLLALIVAAGLDVERKRDARAGVWLGIATALKVFPGLLLVFAAYRHRWRTAVWGACVAVGLSVCALLPLGIADGLTSAQDWLAQSASGSWVLVRRNQSLSALLGRLGAPHPWAIVGDLVLLGLAALVLRRSTSDRNIVHDLGIATVVAVLVSPIAWIHYYFLALPAWIAIISRPPVGRPRLVWVALVVAGIATSGLLTVWSYPSRVILQEHSLFAWGGLLLLAVLLLERWTRHAPSLSATGDA